MAEKQTQDQKKDEDLGIGGAGAVPKPFDASLFGSEEPDKPTSPSFPVDSPFMATDANNPSEQMESSRNDQAGNEKDVPDTSRDTAAADTKINTDEAAPIANYFAGEENLVQSGASFFDSFSSARADENNLFSTPPTSIGATPVTPEGPTFIGIMEEPEGDGSRKTLEPSGANSETVSIDSTNLLADDDGKLGSEDYRKLGSGSNLDTMSMDSTNLLSEEDILSVGQGNESFEIKQGDEDDVGDIGGLSVLNTGPGQAPLDVSIDLLDSPEREENPLEDSIAKISSGTTQDIEKKDNLSEGKAELVSGASKDQSGNQVSTVNDVDGGCMSSEPYGSTTEKVAKPSVDLSGALAITKLDVAAESTSIAQPPPSSSASSNEVAAADIGEKPPLLMSSFSAPSGLVRPDARPRAPFQSSPSQDGDDPFVSALRSSDIDRRHDAWLPSEATQKILANRSIALQGSEYVVRDQLTMPGVIAEEPQGDPVRDLVQRYMGEQEASKRAVLTTNQVTRDEAGLKRLLDAGCLRAAINLTGLLLTSGGQGKGQSGLPSRHTPHLMQMWFIRISLFMKLQQFTAAEQELDQFGNLDKPDLFFEYYPDLYPGRKGSIIPFSFRMIHAEIPMYTGKHQMCLDRLAAILIICHRIIQHLQDGKSEYGQPVELSEENRKSSLELWKSREVRVLNAVGNCLVGMKEYMQAVNVFKTIIEKEPEKETSILSGIARIYLQLGDLKLAQEVYASVEKKLSSPEAKEGQARVHINRGFLKVAQNQHTEAYKHFTEALKIEPTNFMAINNLSVSCLYLGKLKEALSHLENLVNRDTGQYLDESLIFNLCTLYELESSKSIAKKQQLLGLVCRHRGDGFNTSCLKMP